VSPADRLTVRPVGIAHPDDPEIEPADDDAGAGPSLDFATFSTATGRNVMSIIETSGDRRPTVLGRIAPMAGVLSAGLTIAGYLTIGPFPDASTPVSELRNFYATTGGHVTLAGTFLGWAGICFAVFAAAVLARLHGSGVPAVIVGVVALGAAADMMADLNSGAVYQLLGQLGVDPGVSGGALQAWHISGAAFGVAGGAMLFLLGVALAGIRYGALPRSLAWTALVLAIVPFAPHPWGYFASLAFLLWMAVAGVVFTVRPERRTSVGEVTAAAMG
jgi:hypothetical protein